MKKALFIQLPKKPWTVCLSKFNITFGRWFKEQSLSSVDQYLSSETRTIKF